MSFQGDVGGIGLADLLQSLARGRDGVLSLLDKRGLQATLGFQDGQLHYLPEPDEDPEIWRARARSAWVKDPDTRIDSLRMTEIARAHRIENLYRLLDSSSVHFRFAPGPLPERSTGAAISQGETGMERDGPRRDAIYVQSVPVEAMLLEYARLKDELQSSGVEWPEVEDAVLVGLDSNTPSKSLERFWEQCDGSSTVGEIADRLALPLRQVQITAVSELQRGAARLAAHEELLSMVQYETGAGHVGRAAARLRAWVLCAPYGPMPTTEAEILRGEWEAARLQPVLRELATPVLRVVLRRFDCALGNPQFALEHWDEFARVRRDDRICQTRLVHLQAIASADPNVPAIRDLLAMSRTFLEGKRRFAAAALLRIAAARAPESTNVCLELATQMLAAGIGLEAGPWILEAANTLLEEGNAEKALPALKEYVALDPGNREARRLLGRARTNVVQKTLVKRNSLVAIAVLVAVSVGAVVQYRSQAEFDQKLEAVQARLDDPREALRILDAMFPGEAAARVGELRKTLVEKRRIADQAGRTAWMDRYREAQLECTLGDPVLGLKRTLEMPPPPELGPEEERLPLLSDLFNGLTARIETAFASLAPKIDESPEQQNSEARIVQLLTELREVVRDVQTKPEIAELVKRFDAFQARLDVRIETRRSERTARLKKENLAQQDMLIGAARAHASAGDYERALEHYRELLAKDETGKLAPLLQREIELVRKKGQAVSRAIELAREGQHTEAHELLVGTLKDEAATRPLPWKVESIPAGARAKLPDGSERVTPFTLQTVWDEPVELTLELAGTEPSRIQVLHPSDQLVKLSRIADRAWKRGGRIEALPISVGDDHIVCDRDGHLARLSKGSATVWSHDLQSLGGISHAPVFLPELPGHLLVSTEDGEAWIVDVATGTLEGPWNYGKPPVRGPEVTGTGVRVSYRDGATFEWTNRLKPEQVADAATAPPQEELTSSQPESHAGMSVLRRRSSSASVLESPWSPLAVEVEDGLYTVFDTTTHKPLFLARREGDWTYVAWEAPSARASNGRLWISDGRGLRSFAP